MNDKSHWFTEAELPYSENAIRISTKVTAKLHDEQSDYCHIEVYESPFYGRMLVIDGIIQTTESDEFIYHEMMVIAPAILHGQPKSILIIGGGDGGSLRQALRVKSLDKIVQVEIDPRVSAISEQYLPQVSQGALKDKRVTLLFTDGARYVRETKEQFDIIVLDLTDPFPGSPAEQLFGADFLQAAKRLLTNKGVLSMQSGSVLFQPDEIVKSQQSLKQVFSSTSLRTAVVPGYQLSLFAFLYGSDSPLNVHSPQEIKKRFSNITGELQYLSPDVLQCTSILPPYLQSQLKRKYLLDNT